MFHDTKMTWCGKVLSSELVDYGRRRLRGLGNMRHSRTAGEPMKFLQPVNRIWTPDTLTMSLCFSENGVKMCEGALLNGDKLLLS